MVDTVFRSVLTESGGSLKAVDLGDGTFGIAARLISVGSVASLPTPSVTYRNKMAVVNGGAGETDTLYMCLKAVADTYSWIAIATGG